VIETRGATLPFTSEQVFDLAADIERYPEFLPGWLSAHIQKRDADTCYVEQVMGLGPIRLRFESKAVMYRPRRIDITSADAQFRMCDFSWVIAATSCAGCRVSIAAEIELRSFVLQTLVNRFLPASVDGIVRAFEARAHALYAARRG
jgi:coenzyme Q-binding protein COQ10